MDPNDQLAAARRRVLEAEASMLHALASARSALSSAEEQIHEMRRQELKRRTEFFTEQEFADMLRVSESTIARLRKRGTLQPLMVGGLIRYSSLHVEQAHEIFAQSGSTGQAKPKPKVELKQVS